MNQYPHFSPLQWKPLIIVPLVVFMGVLALFTYFDIDKNLAYFLSQRPGGFPYAGSETYEFWFHRFPKIISGTVFLVILGVAVLSIPLVTLLEKIRNRHWQKLLSFYTTLSPVASLRRSLKTIPKTIIITLWLTVIAIVFAGEMIGHLKRSSDVYCPIRIQAYGGEENVPLSSVHEPFPTFAPNGGKCWPGGHAITGFIFEACFFGLYSLGMRRAAWISLAIAFSYGNFLGVTQVLRGQHYLSHQLWSSILIWYFSMMVFWSAEKYRAFRAVRNNSIELETQPTE